MAGSIYHRASFDRSPRLPLTRRYSDESCQRTAIGETSDIACIRQHFRHRNLAYAGGAFPFTKYGTLHGTITQVASDAIQDEKLGLIYSTRVKLAKDTLQVENKTVRLTPGMAVTVEVKTGKRRVIEYFLSPLMKVSSESLRER